MSGHIPSPAELAHMPAAGLIDMVNRATCDEPIRCRLLLAALLLRLERIERAGRSHGGAHDA